MFFCYVSNNSFLCLIEYGSHLFISTLDSSLHADSMLSTEASTATGDIPTILSFGKWVLDWHLHTISLKTVP